MSLFAEGALLILHATDKRSAGMQRGMADRIRGGSLISQAKQLKKVLAAENTL